MGEFDIKPEPVADYFSGSGTIEGAGTSVSGTVDASSGVPSWVHLLPFAPILSGTPYPAPPPRVQPAGYANTDPALDPIRNALNNPSLTHEQRAQLMADYRNAELSHLGANTDLAYALHQMQGGAEGAPVALGGPNKGSHMPLFDKLGKDPDMQALMAKLAGDISSQEPGKLNIQEIYAHLQEQAGDIDDPKRNKNLMALQAMATLVNVSKFDPQGKGTKPPKEILDQLPPGLYDQIKAAGTALASSKSEDAAVMGHNQSDGNAFDNNAHFFTHAYMTASLVNEYGLSSKDAQAVSGLVGAQYELLPTSVYEGSGNGGLKDILMNGEGAAFGADAVTPGKARPLPGQQDGPPSEDRDRTKFPDADPANLPGGAKKVSDGANSKWDMFWNWVL